MQISPLTDSNSASYSLELLQAINDWQMGGSATQKEKRGQRLLELSTELPANLRSEDRVCYRLITIQKGHIWILADQLMLGETISAWTVDLSVAMEFKGGVPYKDSDYKALIFAHKPDSDSVIINLDKLYQDEAFLQACADNKGHINRYDRGIGRWQNEQREVIIKRNHLPIDNVYAIGGYSSDRQKLLTKFMVALGLSRKPTKSDHIEFDKLLATIDAKLGPGWVSGPSKDKVIDMLLTFSRSHSNRCGAKLHQG